jgi:hypothetical protein
MKTILIPTSEDNPAGFLHAGNPVLCQQVPDDYQTDPASVVLQGSIQECVRNGTLSSRPLPLHVLKNRKQAKWQSEFSKRIAAGITIEDITLRADESDRSAFSQLLVLLRESEIAGMSPETVQIADLTGSLHTVSIDAARRLLIAYGDQYHQIWASYMTFKKRIADASSNDELNAITPTF